MNRTLLMTLGLIMGTSSFASDLAHFQGKKSQFVDELKSYIETNYQVSCPDRNFDYSPLFPAFNDKFSIHLTCNSGDTTVSAIAKIRTVGESYHNNSNSNDIAVRSLTIEVNGMKSE